MSSQKSVLVTGCSAGGIGAAIAQAFAESGHIVFATARTPSKISQELRDLSNVVIVELDVTDQESIAEAKRHVNEKTAGRLDILINNAGLNYTMPCLDAPLEDGKRLFDTNLWGVLALCQAFAPFLVATKGSIVNISSIAGHLNTPYMGLYSASKAALTCFSETLRVELAPLGVVVSTIIAGNVQTQFWQKEHDLKLPPGSFYLPVKDLIAAAASGELSPPGSKADEFSSQIRSATLSRSTGLLWKGAMAGSVRWATKFLPANMLDKALSKGRGLEQLAASG